MVIIEKGIKWTLIGVVGFRYIDFLFDKAGITVITHAPYFGFIKEIVLSIF